MKAIDIRQVAEKTALARQTIRNWASLGKFPRPFKLGGKAVWDETDVDSWLLTQKQITLGDSYETQ
jgi:predicted DNA-binding transcriptional regulator AlpA